MVKIKYLARFKDITGEKRLEIDYDGEISGLINVLVGKYGNEFQEALFNKDKEVKDYMKILINGEDMRNIKGLNSHIGKEDEIVIFQTIAGG